MNNKYLKQEWFLTTEVLPSELPMFFSNLPIKNKGTIYLFTPTTICSVSENMQKRRLPN